MTPPPDPIELIDRETLVLRLREYADRPEYGPIMRATLLLAAVTLSAPVSVASPTPSADDADAWEIRARMAQAQARYWAREVAKLRAASPTPTRETTEEAREWVFNHCAGDNCEEVACTNTLAILLTRRDQVARVEAEVTERDAIRAIVREGLIRGESGTIVDKIDARGGQ